MVIEKLNVRKFRSYDALTLTPHPGVNLFFGRNGAGKTNLLEAVHYCALGRSHRTGQDMECVRKGSEAAAVGVAVMKGGVRTEIALKLTPGLPRRKNVFIDRKRAARMSDLMGNLRCVMFSPEDLQLVRGAPSLRRSWCDMMISQLSTGYFIALQQYRKALDQRNAILREGRGAGRDMSGALDDFERAMAEPAYTIMKARAAFLSRIADKAAERYRAVSGRDTEVFAVRYACALEGAFGAAESAGTVKEDVKEKLLARWREHRRVDTLRGATSFGPHREDILMTLNGRDMKVFASQGQIRTAVLSLKLAQLSLFAEETGEAPVLLLDDVMSELDMQRRTRLLAEIGGVQTFVTCTDPSDLEGCENMRSYRVETDADGRSFLTAIHEGEALPEAEEQDPEFS